MIPLYPQNKDFLNVTFKNTFTNMTIHIYPNLIPDGM